MIRTSGVTLLADGATTLEADMFLYKTQIAIN
jgi:hypothetical protein